jgi:hypothetical protein
MFYGQLLTLHLLSGIIQNLLTCHAESLDILFSLKAKAFAGNSLSAYFLITIQALE